MSDEQTLVLHQCVHRNLKIFSDWLPATHFGDMDSLSDICRRKFFLLQKSLETFT